MLIMYTIVVVLSIHEGHLKVKQLILFIIRVILHASHIKYVCASDTSHTLVSDSRVHDMPHSSFCHDIGFLVDGLILL